MKTEDDIQPAKTQAEIDREIQIVQLAKAQYHREGELEFDDDAMVSEGDDNGAYVRCWRWVSFSGTPLDKEVEE